MTFCLICQLRKAVRSVRLYAIEGNYLGSERFTGIRYIVSSLQPCLTMRMSLGIPPHGIGVSTLGQLEAQDGLNLRICQNDLFVRLFL